MRDEIESRFLRRRPFSSAPKSLIVVVADACVSREERAVSGSITLTDACSRMGSGRAVSWCREDTVSCAVTALRKLDVWLLAVRLTRDRERSSLALDRRLGDATGSGDKGVWLRRFQGNSLW